MSVALFTQAEAANIPANISPDDLAKLFRPGNSISVVPTATTPTGNAILPSNTREIVAVVASANSAHLLQLPPPVIGTRVTLINGGTAFVLRSSAPATVGISGGTGSTAGVTVAANTVVELICTSATNWRGTVLSATIATAPVQVAAAA